MQKAECRNCDAKEVRDPHGSHAGAKSRYSTVATDAGREWPGLLPRVARGRVARAPGLGVGGWGKAGYTNRFVHDGANLIAILDATNGLDRTFTWGLDASGTMQGAGGISGLISMTVHNGPNAGTYFYVYDGNHNVAALKSGADGDHRGAIRLRPLRGGHQSHRPHG